MITEDYVSFETAKLLKEKRFDIPCDRWYSEYTPQYYGNEKHICIEFDEHNRHENNYEFICYAPTLQMIMKWLREVHRIDIEVRTHYLNYLKPNDIRYYSGKILKGSEDVIHTIYSKDTYEEVCELAIKYCLENLI